MYYINARCVIEISRHDSVEKPPAAQMSSSIISSDMVTVFFYENVRLSNEFVERTKALSDGAYEWFRWPVLNPREYTEILEPYGIDLSLPFCTENVDAVKRKYGERLTLVFAPSLERDVKGAFLPGDVYAYRVIDMRYLFPIKRNGKAYTEMDFIKLDIGEYCASGEEKRYVREMGEMEDRMIEEQREKYKGISPSMMSKRLLKDNVSKGFFDSNIAHKTFSFFAANFGLGRIDEKGEKFLKEVMCSNLEDITDDDKDEPENSTYRNRDVDMILKTGYIENIGHEYNSGTAVNILRNRIPNFAYVYGIAEMGVKEGEMQICDGETTMFYEEIRGITLRQFVKDNPFSITLEVITQIVLALAMAYEEAGFIHGDLHKENIIIKTLNEPIVIRYTLPYIGDVYVKTKTIPVIIDYGMSQFTHKGRTLYTPSFYSVEGSNFPLRDVFKLACSICKENEDLYGLLDFFLIDTRGNETMKEFLIRAFEHFFIMPQYEKYAILDPEDYFSFLRSAFDMPFLNSSEDDRIYGNAQ